MNNHDSDYLDNLRHSVAHLLAAAVMELWPDTKRTIGPAIENGFYFDFEFSSPLSEADLPRIEKKMHELAPSWHSFQRHELSTDDAKKEYPDNPYKHELIDEFSSEGQTLSFYKSGDYWDLCRGGHVDNPAQELKHFKLLSLAGAYWRGSEKNKMLTRIYGTAFPTKEELEAHLHMLEEAKLRDHKKLGKELDLFIFSDLVGKGLPLWTAKGSILRRELEKFIVDEEIKRGYQHVYTPDIAKIDLYKTSGHYPYYKESMYAPIQIDDEEFMLRPMTCPHHFELYKSKPHSYKELPLSIAELAKLYRYEKSGELMGLLRVRSFCLSDAHIIASRSQAENVIKNVLELIEHITKVLGFVANEDYWFRLSLGNRDEEKKYYKNDQSWDEAENVLRSVLKTSSVRSYEAENEAAFYGPKIDVQMRNVNGKEDTAFTVQYDFVMPKRFQLTFTNEHGEEEEPIVIHRSSIGCIERSIAFLIEKYAGAFPLWLAPVQVALLPVSEKHNDYAARVQKEMLEAGIRVELDDDNKTLPSKIRHWTLQKVPYMCIIGDKEAQSQDLSVAVRTRLGTDQGVVKVASFIDQLHQHIETKTNTTI